MFILETKGLNKTFVTGQGTPQTVLKDVHLQVSKGEFVAIMGPSGSGKSTLLYTISGMDRMTSGSVVFKGQDISGLSESELAELRLNQMGFIFQQMHLLKNLTIRDNIILSAYRAKIVSRRTINNRAAELMKKPESLHSLSVILHKYRVDSCKEQRSAGQSSMSLIFYLVMSQQVH